MYNKFYAKTYIKHHQQALKHIDNEYEYKLEDAIEKQLYFN